MTGRIQSIQANQQPHQFSALQAKEVTKPHAALPLELSHKLQTTLELESMIELFSEGIGHDIPHDGITYQTHTTETPITLGNQAHHSLNYNLKVLEEDLGEIHLFRGRRFSDPEIEQLENLLATLLYPLRNALLYREAVQSAFMDALTGVKNRAAFDSNFSREIELSRRKSSELSLIVLDIDFFKRVNDRFGHTVGDLVLKNVAQAVEATIRCSDALYRYGGEEFVVVLNGTDREGAQLLAERIRQNVESLHFSSPKNLNVTLSLGVTTMQKDDTCKELFERADAALYQAKDAGRNRVIVAQ
ncbi:MAG: GGDEF domain-containing protein [Pseudomonadota bacterium]